MESKRFSPDQNSEESNVPIVAEFIDEKIISPIETSFPLESLFLSQKGGEIKESLSEIKEEYTYDSNGKAPSEEILHIPPVFNPPNRFKVLKKWKGIICEVANGTCRAIIEDPLSSEAAREEVVFSTEEFSPFDLELIAKGAVFYWAIGYEDSPQGQRKRLSMIRLQRLPLWTEKELKVAEKKAQVLKSLFDGSKF